MEEGKSDLKIEFLDSKKNSLFLLSIICLIAVIIRLYYTPYDIPIILDGSSYFLHAVDISILGHLTNYNLSHSGWSDFLSLFFMIFHFDNFIDYMNLQRILSVILSGLTVIPIYFICRKYFDSYYSLIGATIFAFEPRIIINSTLGISESLYIFAITLGILFFLNSNKKIIFLSFGFFAWATIIRSEGLFWFVIFSVLYFLRFRKSRKDCIMFVIALMIFLLVLSPFVIHRVHCCETDAIFGRILGELSMYENKVEVIEDGEIKAYGPNWINGIKLFGWSMIPVFIVFVPIGLILIFKQLRYPNYVLVSVLTMLSIPILYSVSVGPDTRYVYPIFSVFCVISLFGIRWIVNNSNNKKIILGIIISSIIIGSIVFLDFKKIDYTYDEESYEISKLIIKNIKGVNTGTNAVKFFTVAEIENRWPIIESPGELSKSLKINQFSTKEFSSLDEFIEFGKKNELTHLVIDNNHNMQDFFMDVYHNEEKYQYLVKEYDSAEHGYNYHIKKFKINYEYFNKK